MNREAIINDLYFRLGRMPSEDELKAVSKAMRGIESATGIMLHPGTAAFSIGIRSFELSADEAKRAIEVLHEEVQTAKQPQRKTRTFYDWRYPQWKR